MVFINDKLLGMQLAELSNFYKLKMIKKIETSKNCDGFPKLRCHYQGIKEYKINYAK